VCPIFISLPHFQVCFQAYFQVFWAFYAVFLSFFFTFAFISRMRVHFKGEGETPHFLFMLDILFIPLGVLFAFGVLLLFRAQIEKILKDFGGDGKA